MSRARDPYVKRAYTYNIHRDVPKGWLDYSKYGKALQLDSLPFTIFPIKAPLDNRKSNKCLAANNLEDQFFSWEIVLDDVTTHFQEYFNQSVIILGVIDLTGTAITNGKYYYGERISKEYGLKYDKIQVQGHGNLPERWQLDRFNSIMEQYANYVNGKVFKRTFPLYDNPDATPPTVLVHCTHGVNRTGYFISNYLIEEHHFHANKAIALFEKMRGHSIKYGDYREDLAQKEMVYLKQRLMAEMPTQVPLPCSSDSDDDFNNGDVIMSSSDSATDSSIHSDDSENTKIKKKNRQKKAKSGATHVIFLSSSSDSDSSRDSFGHSKKKKSKRKSRSRSRISRDRHSKDRRSKSRNSKDRRSKDRSSKDRKSKDRKSKDRQSKGREFGPRSYTIVRKSQTRCYNTYSKRKSRGRSYNDQPSTSAQGPSKPSTSTSQPQVQPAPQPGPSHQPDNNRHQSQGYFASIDRQSGPRYEPRISRNRVSNQRFEPRDDRWNDRSRGYDRDRSRHQNSSTYDRSAGRTNWDDDQSGKASTSRPKDDKKYTEQDRTKMTEKYKDQAQKTGKGSTENPLTGEPLTIKKWGDLKTTLRAEKYGPRIHDQYDSYISTSIKRDIEAEKQKQRRIKSGYEDTQNDSEVEYISSKKGKGGDGDSSSSEDSLGERTKDKTTYEIIRDRELKKRGSKSRSRHRSEGESYFKRKKPVHQGCAPQPEYSETTKRYIEKMRHEKRSRDREDDMVDEEDEERQRKKLIAKMKKRSKADKADEANRKAMGFF